MRVIFIIWTLVEVSFAATYDEYSLLRTNLLFSIDDVLVRPSSTVDVSLKLHLLGINELDSIEEVLSATGWLTVAWDSGISWNAGTNSDIQYLHFKHDEIWRPDLVIENTATETSILSDDHVRYRLANTGIASWELPVKLNVHCHLNLKLYPMDKQTCGITIASWSYSNEEIILQASDNDAINLDLFSENLEWTIEDSEQRQAKADNVTTLNHSYSRLTFYITMTRNSSYFGLHIILPLILLSGLMSLMFLIPSGTGEKVGYSITTYLVNMVLYVSVTFYLPLPTVGASILGIYYTVILCWDTVAVMLTFIVTHVYHRTTEMSKPTRAILTLMKTLTCKTSRQDVTSTTTLSQGTESTTVSAPDLHAVSTLQNGDVRDYKRHGRLSPIHRRIAPSELIENTTNSSTNIETNHEHDLHRADSDGDIHRLPFEATRHRKIGPIVKREKVTESTESRTRVQWHELACCLDTIFFVVFIATSFVFHLAFIVTLLVSD